VNLLICAEGYRVRLLERLQLICTWILCAIWIWDLIFKGYFCTSAFIFAGVLPQLRMVSVIREHRLGRIFFSVSILVGLFLERYYLVSPTAASATFGRIDLGLVAFSVGGFMLLFFGIRRYLNRKMEGAGSYFGEVDGTDLAEAEQEELEKENSTGLRGVAKPQKGFYIQPWSSEEYYVLRYPLLIGVTVAVLFVVWALGQSVFANVERSFANVIPLLYPVIAAVTAIALCVRAYLVEKVFVMTCREKMLCMALIVLLAACLGAFFAGGSSENSTKTLDSQPIGVDAPVSLNHARLLWNARCATCHGTDGRFNEKFVREFYPVPQKLSVQRLDSLGIDSLVKVILNGRVNMNPYAGRLTPEEAHGLVNYMYSLAKEGEK
jgi:mono/diheme cytochrome c family protein